MDGMLFAESAVFLELDPVGSILLVFGRVVVALFALGAGKRDLLVLLVVGHIRYLPLPIRVIFYIQKMTPLQTGAYLLYH